MKMIAKILIATVVLFCGIIGYAGHCIMDKGCEIVEERRGEKAAACPFVNG